MPNHVHLLIKTYPNILIGDLVWSWKKYVSTYIFLNEEYRLDFEKHYNDLVSLSVPASKHSAPRLNAAESRAPECKQKFIKPASERRAPSIWQREYWDRFIRDQKHFLRAIDYIHQNPVKAGLVKEAEEWAFSSANMDCRPHS